MGFEQPSPGLHHDIILISIGSVGFFEEDIIMSFCTSEWGIMIEHNVIWPSRFFLKSLFCDPARALLLQGNLCYTEEKASLRIMGRVDGCYRTITFYLYPEADLITLYDNVIKSSCLGNANMEKGVNVTCRSYSTHGG